MNEEEQQPNLEQPFAEAERLREEAASAEGSFTKRVKEARADELEAASNLGEVATQDPKLVLDENIGQEHHEPDLRVKDIERAEVEAHVVNEKLDEGTPRDLALSYGEHAGRQHYLKKFNEANGSSYNMEQMMEDHTSALIKFGMHIIESQRQHGETITPNQEAFEAVVKFAEEFCTEYLNSAYSEDGNVYWVSSKKGQLILKKYPSESNLIDGPSEEWSIEPWQSGELFDDWLNEDRKDVSAGMYYSNKVITPGKEAGFDSVTTTVEKERSGITPEELDSFKAMLENFEPTNNPKMPPGYRRIL